MAVSIHTPSTFRQYRTLLGKDLRRELRTREMLTSMGVYALLVIVVFGAALSSSSGIASQLKSERIAVGSCSLANAAAIGDASRSWRSSSPSRREIRVFRTFKVPVYPGFLYYPVYH